MSVPRPGVADRWRHRRRFHSVDPGLTVRPCASPRQPPSNPGPETVFDAIADARNEPRWNSRVSSAELRSGEPIGLGSKFAIVNGGTSYDVTITTYDRPTRLVFEGVGNPDVTIAYTFRSSGERTEMASAFDFRPNGISKLLFAVFAPLIRRDVRKQFASFKTICES